MNTERRLLIERFTKASYHIYTSGQEVTVSTHERCFEIDKLLAARGVTQWAYLTAENPQAHIQSQERNTHANTRLEMKLRRMNKFFLFGEARDPDKQWPAEKSFFIFDLNEQDAKILAKEFDQAAFLHGVWGEIPRIIFTSDAQPSAK